MEELPPHIQLSNDHKGPGLLTRRSILISLIIGFLLTASPGILDCLGRVRNCYFTNFPRDGIVLVDSANNISIVSMDDWDDSIQPSIVADYTFWDQEYVKYRMIYPIIDRHIRKFMYYDYSNTDNFIFTQNQVNKLRNKISVALRADGDPYSAQQILKPDRISYDMNWSGVTGNAVWVVVMSFVFLLISYPFRLLKFHASYNERRTRAILSNHCPNCGYDTRNLPQPRCPECGQTWEPINSITTDHHPY